MQMSIKSINPYNQSVLNEFEEYSNLKLEYAMDLAQNTFSHWKGTSFAERSRLMHTLANLLEERIESLARIISLEMGKIILESRAEILKCAWVCRYYAEHAEQFLSDEPLPLKEANSYISYDPLGVILAIMPWNFPLWQVFRFAAPGIMAGNVGLLKHASNVPQCAIEIEKLFLEAGFPAGVFQSLIIGSGKVNRIIDDSRIRAVTLTGSDIAGRKVAERAGRNLKKLVLELGGSDPFIILKDANITRSVDAAVKARMINCGQSCIAAKRFILDRNIADEFVNGFQDKMRSLSWGDPLKEDTNYGPLAREDLVLELGHQVDTSVQLGAKVLLGGERIDHKGNFYLPTILTNIRPGMPGFDQELFGPVASIITVNDCEEAIEVANKSRFGLAASLWTGDLDIAKKLAREIDAGAVFVNSMVASHPEVPFGGIKDSGYGRELSYLGIREFMNAKSIWISKKA